MPLQETLNGQKDFSYTEAVLSYKGLLNGLCRAVSALQANKPELSDQATKENYILNRVCLLVTCEKWF